MWQKARIVKLDERDSDIPRGLIVWTHGPPIDGFGADRFGNIEVVRAYQVNTRFPGEPGPAFMRTICVELLDEFADDMPLIPWEDWLKGEVSE